MSTTATAQPQLKRKSAMLNLFISQKEINKLKADLQLRQNRRKPAPTPTPTAAAPAETPTKSPTPPPPTPWTTAEDIALLHLRTLNKPFAEIATTLSPRTEAEVEARWKEIGLPAVTTVEKEGEEKAGEEPVKADGGKDGGKGGNAGQKNQKGGGKQKGEGKQQKGSAAGNANQGKQQKGKGKENTNPTAPAPTAEAAADSEEFTDPSPLHPSPNAIIASASDRKVRGILKRGVGGTWSSEDVTIPAGATSLNGRPVIFIEEGDPVGVDELSALYHMHMSLSSQHWIQVASKFFDQTGKRIEPDWLRRKLEHCRL